MEINDNKEIFEIPGQKWKSEAADSYSGLNVKMSEIHAIGWVCDIDIYIVA